MTAPAVRLDRVSRAFGDVRAVDGVSLEVAEGEFFTLLGPSGSGKTTCLRMVAGFERPSAGRVWLSDRDVTDLAPYERDVNTVFQDYALFPHLGVAENVGYGLRIKRLPRAEIARRVEEALALVRLPGFGGRRPGELSGGQRQRVALARALVNRPRVLLLDEPLGALDLKLRKQMEVELKAIQQQVGISFLYVTHDQEEALTLSDRLAVFNHGRIEQVGTPAEVYEQPKTAFVAGFVGVSNLLSGEAARRLAGSPATFAVRPEKIRLAAPGTLPAGDECAAEGTIRDVFYLGMHTRYRVELDTAPDPGTGQGTGQNTVQEMLVVEQNLAQTSMQALAAKGRRTCLLWNRAHNRRLEEA